MLVRIEAEGVLRIIPAITVVIGVGVVPDPVPVGVDGLVGIEREGIPVVRYTCLLYTSDAADE